MSTWGFGVLRRKVKEYSEFLHRGRLDRGILPQEKGLWK
jgi:hypothetical protein